MENIGGPTVSQKRISVVSFAIRESDTNLYWNGISTFSSVVAVWSSGTFSGTNEWVWQCPPLEERSYKLNSRATDYAGNWEVRYGTKTFTYDKTAPVSNVTSIINWGHYNEVPIISGTSYDLRGIRPHLLRQRRHHRHRLFRNYYRIIHLFLFSSPF